jgi:putative transposase
MIKSGYQDRLYKYIAGLIQKENSRLIAIGGIEDHVHLLLGIPLSANLPDLVSKVKANSSRWLRQEIPGANAFRWQTGYGIFTVSTSNLEEVKKYILNQEIHHKGRTFEEEYALLLRKHGVTYNEKYMFG